MDFEIAVKSIQRIFKSILKLLCNSQPIVDKKNHPIADGTFIQLDMTYKWNDPEWQKEFLSLKEAGMHYLVVMGTAFTSGSQTKTVYPTRIQGCRMNTQTDIIEILLRNAQKSGMKVFLGIDFNEEWWKNGGNNPEWLYAQMKKDNLIAHELYRLYHPRYPEAFFGWYWAYEADNMSFRTKKQLSVLSEAINIQLDFLNKNDERLPFMLSPYMNSIYSTPKVYAKRWKYVFEHTGLGKGDIFCPQDSVGGGGLELSEVSTWFAAFRKVVDAKPGLSLWANAESFDHKNFTSAPLKRFISQMELEGPYVDNIITFAYSHYYSPNNIHSGFHKTYVDYVKTGCLEQQSPCPPANIRVERVNGNQLRVTWGPAADNVGVCGYQVYRNNKLIFRTEVQRKYGGNKNGPVMTFTDTPPKIQNIRELAYTVRAFDFAGNISKPSVSVKVGAKAGN